jgi:hypothetical protein
MYGVYDRIYTTKKWSSHAMSLTPQGNVESPLLTTEEAHEYLKICRTSLHNLVKQELLTPVNPVPGRTMYLKSDLDAFITSRRA